MHGTFRSRVERGTATTVRFDARALAVPERKWRTRAAILLAGCSLAALPQVVSRPKPMAVRTPAHAREASIAAPVQRAPRLLPTAVSPSRASPPETRGRALAAALPRPVTLAPVVEIPAPVKTVAVAEAEPLPPPVEPLDPVFVTLPEPTPAAAPPAIEARPLPLPPPSPLALPDPPAPQLAVTEEAPAAQVAPITPAPAADRLRPVDVAQISDSDVRSLRVPQLHEPGLAAGGEPTLSARIAAMQVTPLPPVRYSSSERAVLLAEAPTQMMVRIGGADVGKVDFRMTDQRTVDVKLAGLLDLLAGHYDGAEFARLRNSASADAYVSFDKLRALGLNVRYDPVYDEVRIAG